MNIKNIPIPSDLVLKVSILDIFDESAEAIDITDLTAVSLSFSSGGASKTFDITFSEGVATCPTGVSVVVPTGNEDPYFVVALCTKDLKPGQLTLRSEVCIPDTRFHDDVRKEVSEYVFPIVLT